MYITNQFNCRDLEYNIYNGEHEYLFINLKVNYNCINTNVNSIILIKIILQVDEEELSGEVALNIINTNLFFSSTTKNHINL